MKKSSLIVKVLGIASLIIALAALVFQPVTVAYADDPYLDSNVPTSVLTNKDIEAMNKHEIAWLTSQKQVFNDAYQLQIDFRDLFKLMAKRHKDSTDLDSFMATYVAALRDAQSVHDAATKVIYTQWGFDAQGHVTNRTAALQTVTDGRANLRDAHYRLVLAIHSLHRSYADWHYKIIYHHLP